MNTLSAHFPYQSADPFDDLFLSTLIPPADSETSSTPAIYIINKTFKIIKIK